MSRDYVILVDEHDRETGRMEKLQAHREGRLHRAFSVFVFNARGEWLLQQRAAGKYHGGGLWTNTCCSHPWEGVSVEAAASLRLREEMGFETLLQHLLSFTYRAEVEHGLIEHEYDHVYTGQWEGEPLPEAEEVGGWRWVSTGEIDDWLEAAPQAFTAWFRIVWPEVRTWARANFALPQSHHNPIS